jgi:hypothetical protein
MRNTRPLILILLAIAAAGCRKKSPSREIPMIPSHEDALPASASVAGAGENVIVAGISFETPKSWRRQAPSSPMRAAEFAVPGGDGAREGLLSVYYFGRQSGGSVTDNVERWKGQFMGANGAPSPGSVRNVRENGLAISIVTTEGTYSSGMAMGTPSAPEPDSALWGAIIEGPQGNVFLKITGPKKTLEGASRELEKLLATIRPAGVSM